MQNNAISKLKQPRIFGGGRIRENLTKPIKFGSVSVAGFPGEFKGRDPKS